MTDTPEAEAVRRAIGRLEGGADFKSALEGLLLDLEPRDADSLMLRIKESRGAWIPLLRQGGGRALFVGDALSGTVPPLAMLGFHVTVVDRDFDRLRFARFRGEEWLPGRTLHVQAGDGTLPFADASFDLVVQEGGLPSRATGWGHDFDELARIARDELVLTADNRLAYKRSTGHRGKHHVPRPLEYVRAVRSPARGERTLRGYRQLFGSFASVRSYALYPHASEFSHVVSLDDDRPRLTIGPRERRNLLKLGAKSIGLFPVFTPSFAIVGGRFSDGARGLRIDRVLDGLAERIGEPRPAVDIVVATRSNDCVVHTCPAGSRPDDAPAGSTDPTGRWTLHLPLSPQKKRLVCTHDRFLRLVSESFPAVPVPEPLFAGEVDGVFLTCERRLAGQTAPNLTGRLGETGAMFRDVARDLASLVVEPAAPFTEERFDELIARRFRLVRDLAAVPSTMAAIDRLLEVAREQLVGRTIPLVLYHADLRAKHVQVAPDGRVIGYLDWGASEDVFLPYVDLLHLVVQQRKQEEDCLPAETWAVIRGREGLREHERFPLDDYAQRVGLDGDVRHTLEEVYPVLIAGMAERNWDYSRPRWVHRQYGL